MRSIPNRKLWLGHRGDLNDVRAILDCGMEAVIELADSEPPASLPREMVHCRFPLSDGGENPAWLLRAAVETAARLLKSEIPTLVCCSSGMNRSVCIAAAGMALADERPMDDALRLVAESGPTDVSPGLWKQLRRELV